MPDLVDVSRLLFEFSVAFDEGLTRLRIHHYVAEALELVVGSIDVLTGLSSQLFLLMHPENLLRVARDTCVYVKWRVVPIHLTLTHVLQLFIDQV